MPERGWYLGPFVETEEIQGAGRAAREKEISADVSPICLKHCL